MTAESFDSKTLTYVNGIYCGVGTRGPRLELGRELSKINIKWAIPDYKNNGAYTSFELDRFRCHPQTSLIHLAMGTSFFIVLTIHACASISLGVGRML